MSAIVQQPVSVALDMSAEMKDYKGGLFNGKCGSMLNHGMLLTGYGGKAGTLYWQLQNTLGNEWGMKGYIHITRD
jgi:aminopeptidase C